MRPSIRKAEFIDIPAITDIYNEAIANTVATFDTRPKSMENRKHWLLAHDERHPVLVAEINGVVKGWIALSPWSERSAYDGTAELSVYIHADARGQGIGRALMEAVIVAGKEAGLHTIVARIAEGNAVSVHLHEALGFLCIGVMKEVGYKFDRWVDVILMQFLYD